MVPYKRKYIGTILDSDEILWLNEKHITEGLDHKTLREITTTYHSNHRKHKYEIVGQTFYRQNISNQSNYGL